MNDGGPAYPAPPGHPDTIAVEFDRGMSLRDYFAAAALQGFISSGPLDAKSSEIAACAYQIANAMLAEREKHN